MINKINALGLRDVPKHRFSWRLESMAYRFVFLIFDVKNRNVNDENDDWNGGGFGGGWLCWASAGMAAGIEQPAPVSPGGIGADCAGTGWRFEAGL